MLLLSCLTAEGLHSSGSVFRRSSSSSSRRVTACCCCPWQVLLPLLWLLLLLELQQLQRDGGLELKLRSASMLSRAWMLPLRCSPVRSCTVTCFFPFACRKCCCCCCNFLFLVSFLLHFPDTYKQDSEFFKKKELYLSRYRTGRDVNSSSANSNLTTFTAQEHKTQKQLKQSKIIKS